jgi:hypothetical protein
MDEYEHVEYLTKLIGEAHDLGVRLGIEKLSESHTLDDLYDLEREYRIKAMALRRLQRRAHAQQYAEYKMGKTDVDKLWDARHEALTEKFMREKNMDRIAAFAAAGFVIGKLRAQEEEKEPIN